MRNQNNNPRGANPQPKITISVKSSSQIVNNVCEVSFEAAVFRGQNPVSGQLVILKNGIHRITNGVTEVSTDASGIAVLKTSFDLSDREQNLVLRICLSALPEEISYPLSIPPKAKASSKKDPTESLVVMKYQDDDGNLSFKMRVLDTNGEGVANKKVGIWFGGRNSTRTTNSEGEATFNAPCALTEGEETSIIFSVSGVKDNAKLKLRRKRQLNQAAAFTASWWLGVNNGRAFIVLLAAIFFWFMAFLVGTGNPVLNDNLVSDSHGLSAMESYYNQTASLYAVEIKSQLDSSKDYLIGNYISKKSLLLIALILTIMFIIYFPIAAREEIADALEDVKLKLVERSMVKVDDPFFERLAASASSLGFASNKSNRAQFGPVSSSGSVNPDDKDGDGVKDKKTFGSTFMSYLTLDLATDLLGGIVKRIFHK